MSTIFLLLDAFRRDYLTESNTPFLWRCARDGEHYEGVQQSLGFCERAEILTGMRGDETGFLTAIGFDPDHSPFTPSATLSLLDRTERAGLPLLRHLPRGLGARIHSRLRARVGRMLKGDDGRMSTYFIPFEWLPWFALTEDWVDHRRSDAFPGPSILTLLEEAGGSYAYETFTALGYQTPHRTDSERLEAVVRDAEKSPRDLYLVYVAAPDAYGHLYGPESPEMIEVLQKLDRGLERFVRTLEGVAPGNQYIFLGDHGMLTVSRRVDADREMKGIIRAAGLRRTRDVIYFLDSTMVRVWAMSERARSRLPGALASCTLFSENGSWMEKGRAISDHVPWPDRRYGDHLWLADPGVLVFPDFFHRLSPPKGMHGYDPRLRESQGMCIRWGESVSAATHPVVPLTRVFHVLKRSLGL